MSFRGRSTAVIALVLALAVGVWAWKHHDARAAAAAKVSASAHSMPGGAAQAPVVAPQPAPEQVVIPARSNFVAACTPFHLDAALVEALIHDARPVFNLAHIRAGHTLTLVRNAAGAPAELSYEIAANQWLRLQPDAAGEWSARIETIPYTTRLAGVSGTVESSLFEAVEAAGENDELAVKLADIFGWDLDFYTDPRQGDVFRVLVEKRYLNGKFAGYGQIVAAEYDNAGQPYQAVRFHDDLGMLAYYRPDGRPMKREFLRSPLKFAARITSGFSRARYHPILKIYRPHLGTDFAAPMGTPVQTIGAGIVARAGRYGEDGNMVEIRHSGDYRTLYLHLSRILVHVGERVAQGQTIGLVGMTGLATGPHLDFRIEHGGAFENFEVVRKHLPPATPVSASLMAQFDQIKAVYMPELAALRPAEVAAAPVR